MYENTIDASARPPNETPASWPWTLTSWPQSSLCRALFTSATCASLQQNWFICFQDIMLTSLMIDEQTSGQHCASWQSSLAEAWKLPLMAIRCIHRTVRFCVKSLPHLITTVCSRSDWDWSYCHISRQYSCWSCSFTVCRGLCGSLALLL